MIEVIRILFDAKGILDQTFPVTLEQEKQTYFIEVGDLIENAADLSEDRIELYANRLIEAYAKNDRVKLFYLLWMMGSEVLQEKPELAESLESMPSNEWEASLK